MFYKVWNRWRFILQCRMFCVMVFLGVWLGKEWGVSFLRNVLSEDWSCFPELCDNFRDTKAQSRKVSKQELLWFGHLLLIIIFFYFSSSYSAILHIHVIPLRLERNKAFCFQKLGLWCSVDAKFPTRENFRKFLHGFVIISGSHWRIAKLWNARHLVPAWKMALLCSLAGTYVVLKR